MSQPRQQEFVRFTLAQRIEHWVAVFSFVLLAVTGLPQKFVGYPWAENMIAALGGIEVIRVYHRYAAIVLILVTIYHVIAVTYKVFVKRVGLTMNPGLDDLRDLFGLIRYNLRLSQERPKLPRYNFEEKMEYWAFVWGTAVMVVTGFMLWNPIASSQFLPGSFIPAAKAAHGGEALLAVLAVIIWHFWGVHIRHFNKSMFTGKLNRDDMEHHHALELEQIESGTLPPPAPPEEEARRRRVFIPIGTVILLVLVAGLFWFVTFEETAITTVVAAEARPEPYQPLDIDPGRPSLHPSIQEYTGPESCAASGCHNAAPLETAAASNHSRRIAEAGPNPLLAKLVEGIAPPNEAAADCLLCHADDYQPDDLVASARTVRAAGGDNCLRCHASSQHPRDDVHNGVGLACVSCHTSIDHQMDTEVNCTNCHADLPHTDPVLNSKHQRLDCRTCHIGGGSALTVDVSQPIEDPVTAFFNPTVESNPVEATFAWTKDGQVISDETEGAKIVPLQPVKILAPADFDPADYALSGEADGELVETDVSLVPSHGVSKQQVRTCVTCHGSEADFDFESLGLE